MAIIPKLQQERVAVYIDGRVIFNIIHDAEQEIVSSGVVVIENLQNKERIV